MNERSIRSETPFKFSRILLEALLLDEEFAALLRRGLTEDRLLFEVWCPGGNSPGGEAPAA